MYFKEKESLAVSLWRVCLFLVLILCIYKFVSKFSWLLVMKFVNESIYWHGTGRIWICLNRSLHEVKEIHLKKKKLEKVINADILRGECNIKMYPKQQKVKRLQWTCLYQDRILLKRNIIFVCPKRPFFSSWSIVAFSKMFLGEI